MAGNSNSGRKSWKFEAETKDVLQLSFGILNRALTSDDSEFSLEKKAELASKFIVKRIPSIDAPESPLGNGNRILIYVSSNGDGKDLQQIFSSQGAEQNSRLPEEI